MRAATRRPLQRSEVPRRRGAALPCAVGREGERGAVASARVRTSFLWFGGWRCAERGSCKERPGVHEVTTRASWVDIDGLHLLRYDGLTSRRRVVGRAVSKSGQPDSRTVGADHHESRAKPSYHMHWPALA
eukprot:3343158-Prymnesium_polylepis.1